MATEKTKKLYRSESEKVIAGICGGLARYFEIDPVIIRILFIALAVFGGGGFVLYLILWLVIPSKSKLGKKSEDYIKENVEELKNKSRDLAGKEPKVFLGIILIIVGLSLLGNNLGFFAFHYIWRLWPIVIIIIGISMLSKKR